MTELRQLLTWVITAGGAGWIAYGLIANVPALGRLAPLWKRVVAYALTAVIAIAAFLVEVVFGYTAQPVTWRQWVEAIISIAMVAYGASQAIHAARELKR